MEVQDPVLARLYVLAVRESAVYKRLAKISLKRDPYLTFPEYRKQVTYKVALERIERQRKRLLKEYRRRLRAQRLS